MAHAVLVQRVRVHAQRNDRAEAKFVVLVILDEQHRGGGRGGEAEERAAVVVRGAIAGLVLGNGDKFVSAARQQILQRDRMGVGEETVRRRQVQRRVRAVAHDGVGRLIGLPEHHGVAEGVRGAHAADDRRQQIAARRRCAQYACRGVEIIRRDCVVVGDAKAARDGRGGGCDAAREGAGHARRRKREGDARRLRGAADVHVQRRLTVQIEINDAHLDRPRHRVGAAIKEHQARAGRGQTARNDKREILIHRARVTPRVLRHIARAHTNRVRPRHWFTDEHALHVVQHIRRR